MIAAATSFVDLECGGEFVSVYSFLDVECVVLVVMCLQYLVSATTSFTVLECVVLVVL